MNCEKVYIRPIYTPFCNGLVEALNLRCKRLYKDIHALGVYNRFIESMEKEGVEKNKEYNRIYNKFIEGIEKKRLVEEEKADNIEGKINNQTFKEEDHPRDSDGKFTDGGETGTSTTTQTGGKENERDRSNKTNQRTDDFRGIQARSVELLDELGRVEGRSRRYKRIDESIRRRYSGYVQRKLHASMDGDNHGVRVLKNKKGESFKIHNQINPKLFHDAFQTIKPYLKQQELVDLHDDYSNCKCYLSDDGMQGFAISKDGNLISVFNADQNKKGFVKSVAQHIKEQGATHLDCYGGLAKFYKKVLGFQVASKMRYNMDYDHHEISRRYRNPTISFMVLSDKEITTRNFNKDQYDEAVAYQKQCLNVKTGGKRTSNSKIDVSNRRTIDENGFMLITASPILRSGILEYLGSEIADEDGFCDGVKVEPNKSYKVYLPIEELQKSASTFNLIPIVNNHTWLGMDGEDAKDHQEGTTASDASVIGDKLYVSLKLTGDGIIEAVKEGKRELSASYTNILKRAPEHEIYDFVALDYHGNHIALVDRGRCGDTVAVANRFK